jgi:DNA (cytosine-5)-methyltransferase 1
MIQHGQHWTCSSCVSGHAGVAADHSSGGKKIKVLNLYAGVGGNRYKWPDSLEVTAVEINPSIAAEYKASFPNDILVIGDAHQYLLKNYKRFDIIWTSPPCQSHTKMNYTIEHKRYIDFKLWQEIIFLRSFYKGRYLVENVIPYYEPLIRADFILCRHSFWTNVPELRDVALPDFPAAYHERHKGIMIMPKDVLCKWLGINAGSKNIYLTAKSNTQIYRNCVHPVLGASIMEDILRSMQGV